MAKDAPEAEDWEYNDLAPIESLTSFGSTSSRGVVPADTRGRALGTVAEPPPPPLPLPPSIESLTTPPAAVTEGMGDLYRTKIARQDAMFAETEARLEEDRARAKRAYEATGIQPGEFQPWDADRQREKYSTAPLEAFGSLGSVFAMIASAFTRDPMTNALNGAAAAMTAIRDGDEKNYVRAYDAWKSNTDLAVKRHNIQQQAYTNAITLMDSDMRLGTAKATMEAARFGDQKSLFLINNGMLPEFIDLQIKRNQAVTTGIEAGGKLTEDGFRRATLKSMMDEYDSQAGQITGQSPTEIAGRKLALYNHIFGKNQPVPQEAFGLLLAGMPNAPIEQVIKKAQEMGLMPRSGSMALTGPAEIARRAKAYEEDPNSPTFGDHKASYDRAAKEVTDAKTKTGSEAEFMQHRIAELVDADAAAGVERPYSEVTEQARDDWRRKQREGTKQGQNVANFDANLADVKADPQWASKSDGEQRNEAKRRTEAAGTHISGNKQVDLQQRINKFTHSIETTDKILDVLERRKGAAGLAGKIMRIEERLENILPGGRKGTEYVQMMRDVELLRGWAKELLFSKNERLKAEGQRINDIIAGTSAGDTGPNTVAALRAAKNLFRQMRGEDMEILQGRGPGRGGAPVENKPAPGGWTPPAHDKPLKKSALDDEETEPTAFAPGSTAPILSAEQFIRNPGRAQVRRPMTNLSEQEVTVGEPIDVPEGQDAMEVYRRAQRRR